jgi:hypothetical protein
MEGTSVLTILIGKVYGQIYGQNDTVTVLEKDTNEYGAQ